MLLAAFPAAVAETGAIIAVVGGLVAGLRAVVKVTKVIDGQLQAMEKNTTAVNQLSDIMGPLHEQVNTHERRLDVIEPVVFPHGVPRLTARESR